MPGRRITADNPPPVLDPPPQGIPEDLPPGTVTTEAGETRRVVGQSASSRLTELTEAERTTFSTLLSCGQMATEIDVMGFPVTIENLDTNDDLMVGQFAKDYLGSDAYQRAWQLATVACGIRTIEGRPVYTPMIENPSDQHMFNETVKRLGKYRPVVITEIYTEILKLDLEFGELRETLVKPNG